MAAPYTGTGGSAEYTIRGIDIQKLVEGFAEEGVILKSYCRVTPTTAREIRYYSKASSLTAAGYLLGPTTTGITDSLISNTSQKSVPVAVEPSYTRATAWIRKYFAESPLISIEDLNDCDFDIWADMIKDIVRAVNYQVDARIYTVMTTATGVQTAGATAVWTSAATADPIKDILTMKQALRAYYYDPEGAILYMKSSDHKNLLTFLINVKGSSIHAFTNTAMGSGVVQEILGCKVVVSETATAASVVMFIPDKSMVYKQFIGLTTAIVDDPGIGKKVRVWSEGEPICVNPKSVYVLTTCA